MRPKVINPQTRRACIEAAIELFLEQGYAATGLDAICRRAKISKGALFHYFANKEAIGLAALDSWVEGGFSRLGAGQFTHYTDPRERALGLIDHLIELSANSPVGCLVGVLAQEVSQAMPQIRQASAHALDRLAEMLERDLRVAFERTPPRSGQTPRSLAQHFVVVFQGANLLARVRQDNAVRIEHLRQFRNYLAGELAGAARPAAQRRARKAVRARRRA